MALSIYSLISWELGNTKQRVQYTPNKGLGGSQDIYTTRHSTPAGSPVWTINPLIFLQGWNGLVRWRLSKKKNARAACNTGHTAVKHNIINTCETCSYHSSRSHTGPRSSVCGIVDVSKSLKSSKVESRCIEPSECSKVKSMIQISNGHVFLTVGTTTAHCIPRMSLAPGHRTARFLCPPTLSVALQTAIEKKRRYQQ